jgi:hypothetical protein
MMRGPSLLRNALLVLLALTATQARAELSEKQARKLIQQMAGLQLPSKAVRVGKIKAISPSVAETNAEIELVFRLTQNQEGYWRVSEIRAGSDKWENLDVIARANKFELPAATCDAVDPSIRKTNLNDPGVKRARCLIANLFGVSTPSDAVRIREVSSLGMPLGSEPSALVVARVQMDFRLAKVSQGWHVTEFRSGNRDWLSLDSVPTEVDLIKRTMAAEDLNTIAQALNAFRRDRGHFVVSDKHPVLIDQLSPQYLVRILRLDPWHNPYNYQGESDHFLLSSAGPDGKLNTSDDITVTDQSR